MHIHLLLSLPPRSHSNCCPHYHMCVLLKCTCSTLKQDIFRLNVLTIFEVFHGNQNTGWKCVWRQHLLMSSLNQKHLSYSSSCVFQIRKNGLIPLLTHGQNDGGWEKLGQNLFIHLTRLGSRDKRVWCSFPLISLTQFQVSLCPASFQRLSVNAGLQTSFPGHFIRGLLWTECSQCAVVSVCSLFDIQVSAQVLC